MTHKPEFAPEKLSIERLQKLAADEEWEAIDAVLGTVADDTEFLEWTSLGIEDENGNIRDLAVSIIESSSHQPSPDMVVVLKVKMESDDNPYVRFRSAFALFKHGNRESEVIDVIKEALGDEDVAEIAQSYLAQQ